MSLPGSGRTIGRAVTGQGDESLFQPARGDLQVAGRVWVSSRRATASVSPEWISTVSPRTSTPSTPGMARSATASAPGSVARMVRPDAGL